MLSSRAVMALLAVIALSAEMVNSAAAPDACTAADIGKGFCLTCKMKAKCNTEGAPADPVGNCTKAGEACTVLAGVAACKAPAAGDPCYCNKAAQCDSYDPDSVLVCLSGGMTVSKNCSATEGMSCVDGACEAVTTTPSPGEVCAPDDEGFVAITPMCSSAVYCSGGKPLGTSDCASGEYFDVDGMECLPAPPVPCTGCGTGACPDKSDCSKFYICEGGAVLDEEECDTSAPDFDIVTNACVAAGTGTCTGNANCTYGLTTTEATTTAAVTSSDDGSTTDDGSDSTTGDSTSATSRPADCTAANVGERYPYDGDCKKYWSCRMIATGVYKYVEGTCLGSLVFNPDTGYCDTVANVPECA